MVKDTLHKLSMGDFISDTDLDEAIPFLQDLFDKLDEIDQPEYRLFRMDIYDKLHRLKGFKQHREDDKRWRQYIKDLKLPLEK